MRPLILTLAVLFIPLTKLGAGYRAWNVFMWAMLIIGHGMLIVLYSRAWQVHYSGGDYFNCQCNLCRCAPPKLVVIFVDCIMYVQNCVFTPLFLLQTVLSTASSVAGKILLYLDYLVKLLGWQVPL